MRESALAVHTARLAGRVAHSALLCAPAGCSPQCAEKRTLFHGRPAMSPESCQWKKYVQSAASSQRDPLHLQSGMSVNTTDEFAGGFFPQGGAMSLASL